MSMLSSLSPSSPRLAGSFRPPAVLVALLAACVAVPTPDAAGQVAIGGHGVSAADAFGGSRGLGARVAFRVPLLPVEFLGTAEQFFPECDDLDCSLQMVRAPERQAIVRIGILFGG